MLGGALVRVLHQAGYENLLLFNQDELDLLDQHAMLNFYYEHRPDYVFDATQKTYYRQTDPIRSGQDIYEQLQLQINLIHGAWLARVKKLLLLADSSIYSVSDTMDLSSDSYAMAKLAGIKMCQAYRQQYECHFISLAAADFYGPNDIFEPVSPRILPSLIFRFHHAKMNDLPVATIMGNSTIRHEYLHVNDLADACFFIMNNYDKSETINVGSGEDLSINELAHLVKTQVGYDGKIDFNHAKPDSMPQKLLDISCLNDLGWHPRIHLADGIRQTYEWFLENQKQK